MIQIYSRLPKEFNLASNSLGSSILWNEIASGDTSPFYYTDAELQETVNLTAESRVHILRVMLGFHYAAGLREGYGIGQSGIYSAYFGLALRSSENPADSKDTFSLPRFWEWVNVDRMIDVNGEEFSPRVTDLYARYDSRNLQEFYIGKPFQPYILMELDGGKRV